MEIINVAVGIKYDKVDRKESNKVKATTMNYYIRKVRRVRMKRLREAVVIGVFIGYIVIGIISICV